MKKIALAASVFLLTLTAFFGITSICSAEVFDLSFSLVEGGYRLDLTPSNAYKGVKVDVTTDAATRYEILLSSVRPLQNRDNPSVFIKEDFVVRGLRGTNQFGDFRLPPEDAPVRMDQVIYVSNATGSSDSVTLVFGIKNIETLTPGFYTGQLSFTLRPIGSARAQVVKYLDVSFNISQSAARDIPKSIQFTTASGIKRISLGSKRTDTNTADILVSLAGTFKQQFSIIQTVLQPLESKSGTTLDNAVTFSVKEASPGVAATQEQSISSSRQILYTSLADGRADQDFIITYTLNEPTGQPAGRYASKIQFLLEEKGTLTNLESIPIEVENERIFDLKITPQDQKGSLDFFNVKPGEPPKKNEVLIEVKSNIGKRYQVNQKLFALLTSKEGQTVPEKHFTVRTESVDTKGALRFIQSQGMKPGETTLFISDAKGSSDTFKLIYELSFPNELKAGDYSTRITYSLSEI